MFREGTSGDCNGGAIFASSVGVEGDNFISQLAVNISNGLNNKTVSCSENTDFGLTLVGSDTLFVVLGELLTI